MSYIEELTATQPATSVPYQLDVLLHVKCEGDSPPMVGWMPWETAMGAARHLHRERAVLADAVVGCSRYMEYVGHHMAFLAGTINDSEFDEVSQAFCISPGADISDLAERIEIILRETGVVFPPDQLEEFCSVTGEEIEAALELLAERGLVLIER